MLYPIKLWVRAEVTNQHAPESIPASPAFAGRALYVRQGAEGKGGSGPVRPLRALSPV
jgi:hypothetical protein